MTTLRSRHSGGFSVYNPKYQEPEPKSLTKHQKFCVLIAGIIAVGMAILFSFLTILVFNYVVKQ